GDEVEDVLLEVRAGARDGVDLVLADHLGQRDPELRGAHRAGHRNQHLAATVQVPAPRLGRVDEGGRVEVAEMPCHEVGDRSVHRPCVEVSVRTQRQKVVGAAPTRPWGADRAPNAPDAALPLRIPASHRNVEEGGCAQPAPRRRFREEPALSPRTPPQPAGAFGGLAAPFAPRRPRVRISSAPASVMTAGTTDRKSPSVAPVPSALSHASPAETASAPATLRAALGTAGLAERGAMVSRRPNAATASARSTSRAATQSGRVSHHSGELGLSSSPAPPGPSSSATSRTMAVTCHT